MRAAMPNKKHPDAVTTEYVEAYRMGVFIRTPLEKVAFFQAEHKAVVAHTKANGCFILDIPLHQIETTLKDKVTRVHRSYLVPNDMLPGLSHWRDGNTTWAFGIVTSVQHAGRIGLCPHKIPISRRLTNKVKAKLRDKPWQT